MAHLNRSVTALRIFGDSLDPKEVSKILNCAPTDSYLKGDVKVSKNKNIIRKSGMWSLNATDQEPGNLDAQVTELLGKLNPDLSIWTSLTKTYKVDLFCGFFMEETDEGIEISATTLQALGERKIKIGICIYAPIKEIANDDLCPCDSGKKYGQCCAPKVE